ncbi:La-domain-containing protein [Backusella circina FSU 941]|nr:La-domain-containing protein [Backusella circina FSU 941]
MANTNQQIRKQVNFYLSDSNLPYDKFLWTLREKTPEGWIPIETIAGFRRMKMFTDDLDTVIKALKEEESDLYEFDAEDKNIRRKTPVTKQDHVSRSIHVKGFPLVDVGAEDATVELFKLQDKVDDLFAQYGKVLCTRLKKTDERPSKFKGTAYIEFSSPEEAKKAAEAKELDFDGNKLELLYRPDYIAVKNEEYKGQPRKYRHRGFDAFKPMHHNNDQKRKFEGKNKNGNYKKQRSGNPKADTTEAAKPTTEAVATENAPEAAAPEAKAE